MIFLRNFLSSSIVTAKSLLQLQVVSTSWTADKDLAQPFDIFIRHTSTPCTFLVQNTSGIPKLFVPDFVSINQSSHCTLYVFMTTDLIHKDGCSAAGNNGCYHREISEILRASLAGDDQKVSLHKNFVLWWSCKDNLCTSCTYSLIISQVPNMDTTLAKQYARKLCPYNAWDVYHWNFLNE